MLRMTPGSMSGIVTPAQMTAGQQSNSSGDLALTRRIRKSIMRDHSLSMMAKNVKIVTANTFVKPEIKQTGAAQQQPIPLLQIVLMEVLEHRPRAIHRDAVEIIPAKAADSASIVSSHRRSNRLSGNEGNSGIGPGASRAMVTRSLRAFMQVIRAVPVNSIWASDASAASRRIT